MAAVAIVVLVAVVALRPGTEPEVQIAGDDIVEPEWEWEEFAEYYPVADTLPDPDLLAVEQGFWDETDKVDEVIGWLGEWFWNGQTLHKTINVFVKGFDPNGKPQFLGLNDPPYHDNQ